MRYHQIVVYPVLHGKLVKESLALQLVAVGTGDIEEDNVQCFQRCHMSEEVSQSDFLEICRN